MRLTPDQVAIIRNAVAEVAGADAVVRLFGSRTRDDLKGGDIDLHVEVGPEHDGATVALDCKLWARLAFRLRTELIDIVWSVRGMRKFPMEEIAYRDGVLL